MKQPDAPDHDAWCAWHPTELARRLTGVSVPWCVAGGWALDLWHGHQTREHEDLEFTVLRSDVPVFRRALADMEFHTAGDGIVKHLPAQVLRLLKSPRSGAWTLCNIAGGST